MPNLEAAPGLVLGFGTGSVGAIFLSSNRFLEQGRFEARDVWVLVTLWSPEKGESGAFGPIAGVGSAYQSDVFLRTRHGDALCTFWSLEIHSQT